MKLIIGLGNPGKEYESTRHNTGFILIDELAAQFGASFQAKPKFKARIAETNMEGEKVLLVKPTTFYNLVGESIRTIRDFYKCDNSDILIIHDDIALPFGTIRTRLSGSDGGNNGIKSLNQHLGQDYARIRVGMWNEHHEDITATDFVLEKLSGDKQKALQALTKHSIIPLCESFILKGTLAPHTIKTEE